MQKRPIQQKRFQMLKGMIAVAFVIAGIGTVVVVHSRIKQAIAAQTVDKQICLAPRQPQPICFTTDPSQVLSSDQTTAIATQPDGPILATASQNAIQLWNLKTQQRLQTLTGHTNWITAIAFSPDGKTLASSSLDRTIKLWNIPSGILKATINSGRVTSLAFSPDGATLASGSRLDRWADGTVSPKGIQLWNIATQQMMTTIASKPVTAIAFSPNGQYLAAGAQTTQIWKLPTGTLLHTLNSNELNSLIFNRNGQLLITGSDGIRGENGTKFWQVSSGKQVRVLHSVSADFALSPNGKTLATTYGGNVNLWRIYPFGYLGTLRGSLYSGLMVAFGLNGQVVVTGSSDGVKLWKPQESGRSNALPPLW